MSSERRWRHGITTFVHVGAVEGTEDTGVQKRACVPLLEGRKKVTDPWVGGRRGG